MNSKGGIIGERRVNAGQAQRIRQVGVWGSSKKLAKIRRKRKTRKGHPTQRIGGKRGAEYPGTGPENSWQRRETLDLTYTGRRRKN